MRRSDPITTELVRYELVSLVEEMKRVFKRTTTLAILYELNDFGISAFDASYRVLADASGLPVFSGSLYQCIESCVHQVGKENLAPGDVLTTSYPFDTGDQPVDAAVMTPVFFEDEIIGYTALKAHMGDLGAIDPYPTASRDMYQEGLLLPAVWLYRKGDLVQDVVRVIRSNSRIPNTTANSFIAGASAIRAGAERMQSLAARYGKDVFEAATSAIIEHGEKVARAAVASIPDGCYRIVDYLDNNGVDREPVKIAAAVTIRGSDFVVDLSESAPQQGGPVNSPWPGTVSALRYVIKSLTTPREPTNEGHFGPLQVVAPAGNLFHPEPPAPTFVGGWSSARLLDLVPEALASVIPDRVTASSGSDIVALVLAYFDLGDGRGDYGGGADAVGLGAKRDRDGENALIHHSESCCCNVPIEVQENRVPVLIPRYELRQDSGGPGKFRGGLGVVREFQTLEHTTAISMVERTEASVVEGPDGGRAGLLNAAVFHPGTGRERAAGKNLESLLPGDLISIRSGGGSGWGDPLDREPERVLHDVIQGYVSSERAEADYGVVLKDGPPDVTVDDDATARLRALRRESRGIEDPHANPVDRGGEG